MSCTVLAIIIVLNRVNITWIKSSAILIALIIGYALAGFMGHLDFSGMKDAPMVRFTWYIWFKLLLELVYSNGLYLSGHIFEAIGDITATSKRFPISQSMVSMDGAY